MKKVLLRYYSANNLGDDLFVKLLAERYKNRFTIITHQKVVSLESLSNVVIKRNKLLSTVSYYLNRARVFNARWIRYFFQTDNLLVDLGGSSIRLNHLAKTNDLMVYIGGSIFMEYGNIDEWELEAQLYKNFPIPYYIIGANFGPYRSPEFVNIAKGIVAGARDVCFRDQASYDVFRDVPSARLASDVVFSLKTSRYPSQNKKTVVFSIIDCSGRFKRETAERYDREIIKLTEQCIRDGYHVTYMSFCRVQGDLSAIERILSMVDERLQRLITIHSYEGDVEQALSTLASCEVIVGSRFHANILGLVFGKKVLPIIYSNKTEEVLKDIGFTGPIIDLTKDITFDGVDLHALKNFDVSEQVERSQLQFKELDKVLRLRQPHE